MSKFSIFLIFIAFLLDNLSKIGFWRTKKYTRIVENLHFSTPWVRETIHHTKSSDQYTKTPKTSYHIRILLPNLKHLKSVFDYEKGCINLNNN